MPVGQLITLGIGTPSSIRLEVLTGLMTSSITGSDSMISPLYGVALALAADTVYAVPPRTVNIEWYSAAAAIIEGSIDQTHWVTLGSLAGAGNGLISSVAALFIRPNKAVTVVFKKKKKL